MGYTRPSQPLKSPTTLTRRALGAHTANEQPRTPSTSRRVRAEAVVEPVVVALGEEVQVEFAQDGSEGIRVGVLGLVAGASVMRRR